MKKAGMAAIAIVVIGVIGGTLYWSWGPQRGSPVPAAAPPETETGAAGPKQTAAQDTALKRKKRPQPAPKSRADPEPPGPRAAAAYCAGEHDPADSQALAQSGGLVLIFQHAGQLDDAYGCAAVFLKHGGHINAPDPRNGSAHLTPLLFAIKRNDTHMVRFMLAHGADPGKRAGPDRMKPYGYAVSQALEHRQTNYNKIIALLDSALSKQSTKAAQ